MPLSFSFTHSFFLRKVRSAAGAATPVYAENAVYAVCAPCVNDSLSAVSAPCGNADSLQEFEQLVEAIETAGVDITSNYNDWYKIAIAIANIYIYLIYI